MAFAAVHLALLFDWHDLAVWPRRPRSDPGRWRGGGRSACLGDRVGFQAALSVRNGSGADGRREPESGP